MGTKFTFKILKTQQKWMAIVLLGIFVSNVWSACGKGCIACDTTKDSCIVCDPFDKYQLDEDGNCTQVTIPNCKVGDPKEGEAACLQCDSGMIFDFTEKKCVEVPSNKKILDCDSYNQAGECVECSLNHYISNGRCLPAAIEVDDCLVFTEANFCSVCKKNKRFDDDIGKCVDFNTSSNCASHSFMTCDKCLSGFHLSPNSSYSFANSSTPSTGAIVFINTDSSNDGNFRSKAISNCLPDKYTNCLTFTVTDGQQTGCATCGAGRYLNTVTKNCDLYPAVHITNCKVYSNSSTCYQCMENFWLNGNQCDAITAVSNCLIYERTSDKCATCIEANYLDIGTNTCPPRVGYPIASCGTHNPNSDECSACLTDFRLTDDNKKCFAVIPNCGSYDPSSTTDTALKCQTCNVNYFVSTDKLMCTVQKIDFCVSYELNLDSCNTCLNGYYKSGTTKIICEKKAINGCKTFTTDQENHCSLCNNLYSLSVDQTTCTSLTDTKCAENTPNTTTCIKCNKNSYLDGGGVCQDVTKTIDPLCTKTTADGTCVECIYGYLPFKMNNYLESLPSNCVQANSTNGNCTQCAADKDGADDSGNILCTNAASTTGKCKQLKAGSFGALADNDGDCDLCRDQNTHYLSSNTCQDRSLFKSHNCSSLNVNGDNCETCSANTHSVSLSETSADCLNPPSVVTVSTIANCLVYDFWNDGKCILCENNYTLTVGAPDTCVANSGTAPHDWDLSYIDFNGSMEIKQGLPYGATAITNCLKHYYDYNTSSILCAECDPSTTPVIKYLTSSNFLVTPNANGLSTSDLYAITECKTMQDSDFMRYETGTALAISADCGSVFDLGAIEGSNTGNYICTSCKEGKVGIVKQFNWDKAGVSATSWVINSLYPQRVGYGSCTDTSEMTRSLKVPLYTSEDPQLFFFRDVLYDTCTDSTKNVVHIRAVLNDFYSLGVEGPTSTERVNTVCQVIPAQGKIDNCQVYTLEPDTAATRDLSLESTYKCLTCKPGFTFPTGKVGEQCLEIQNCNLSGTNTWMNGCETCDSNFSWEINNTANVPLLLNCRPNDITTETNCLVSDTSGECRICKPGKTLNSTTKECDDYPSYCASQGFPNHNIASEAQNNSMTKLFYQQFFLHFFVNHYKTAPSICASCSGSRKMFMAKDSTDVSNLMCVSNDIQRDLVEGCDIYSAVNKEECVQCKNEYILRRSDSSCVLRDSTSTFDYCLSFGTGTNCYQCKEGYVPNNSGGCVDNHNCLTPAADFVSNNYCAECKPGYKRNESLRYQCIPITENDGPCMHWAYTSTRAYCLSCKDCSQTPIRNESSSNEQHVYCVNNQSSYDLSGFKLFYESDSNYLEGEYSTTLKALPSGKYIKTSFEAGSAMAEYVCVREPYDLNCTSFDSNNKYECTACAPGYYVNSNYRCSKGTIDGCVTYSSSTVCSSCNSVPSASSNWKSYYSSGNGCAMHTHLNCQVYSTNSNTCSTCENGYYKDTNNMCQTNKLATHCKVSTTNTDTCVTCANKYYKNSSDLCEPHTVSNCNTYSSTNNHCTDCIEGYYLSNNNCLENTAPNCKTKSTSANACSECNLATEYSNGSDGCVDHEVMTSCKTYNTSSSGCFECNDGFYKSGSDCLANPSGIADCVEYSSATTCTACAATHFFNGTACAILTTTVTGCARYSADGVCSICNPLHFLSAAGDTCEAVDVAVNNCATWTDKSNCATCSGNFVLQTDATTSISTCVSSGLDHCLVAVLGTPNTCTSCSDGFILRAGECVAPKISITNCRIYDEPTENCVECYPGNVLSADKLSCLSKIAEAGEQCSLAHIKSDENPTCNICEFGYSMNDEGSCVQCGGEGCFVCDTSDLTKCKVCATTYYMSSSGSCSLNDPPEPESNVIFKFMSVILLLILTLKLE